MATITRDDIIRLATMSSLQLSDTEIDHMKIDIENILTYVDQLETLETEGVEPTYQVVELKNVGRADEAKPSSISREILLALAPDQEKNQIKVQKVL